MYSKLSEDVLRNLKGPPFAIMFNYNPRIGKKLHIQKSVGRYYLSILKLQQLRHWSLGMDK